MQSRIFFIITYQFSVSHDLLEIITIYLTQGTFLIIINVENNFAASYCVWKWWYTFQDLFAFIKYIN